MTASPDLPPPTNKTPLPYVTIVAATLALLLPLAVVAAIYWTTRSPPAQTELTGAQKLGELQATEQRQMTTYDWIEKPTQDKPGVVRIPVSQARELVVKEMTVQQEDNKR
jgi:hypothetical protein